MPSLPLKPFLVENKCNLLSELIDLSKDWPEHDVHGLFKEAEKTFKEARNTSWQGKEFWKKLEREEQEWEAECEGGDEQRRRGHERGSEYDQLMSEWSKIWSKMTAKNWQWKLDNRSCEWEDVPKEFKQANGVDGYCVYAYGERKLTEVVEAAAKRALETNKPDLAECVRRIHKTSMHNLELKNLLEKTLTQSCTAAENVRFQVYVNEEKKKLKQEKQMQKDAPHTSPLRPVEKQVQKDTPQQSSAKPVKQLDTAPLPKSSPRPAPKIKPVPVHRHQQSAAPEEIQYDPPNCACANCRGGKEWQHSKELDDKTHQVLYSDDSPLTSEDEIQGLNGDVANRTKQNGITSHMLKRAPAHADVEPSPSEKARLRDADTGRFGSTFDLKHFPKGDSYIECSPCATFFLRKNMVVPSSGRWPQRNSWQPHPNPVVQRILGDLQAAPALTVQNTWANLGDETEHDLTTVKELMLRRPWLQKCPHALEKALDDQDDAPSVGAVPDTQLQNVSVTAGAEEDKAEATGPAPMSESAADDPNASTADRDPLVARILGDLQFEPVVQKVLQHNGLLHSEANVRAIRARESALEIIKAVLEATPEARTSVEVFMEKLQDMEDSGRRQEGRPVEARKPFRAQKDYVVVRKAKTATMKNGAAKRSREVHENHDAHASSSSKRLRVRSSTGQSNEGHDRTTGRWPCPTAEKTGCTTMFSKPGHAVRHASTVHGGKKEVKCPSCGKRFARNDNMVQHHKNVHGSRPPQGQEMDSSSDEDSDAEVESASRPHKRRRLTRDNSSTSLLDQDLSSGDKDKSGETSSLTDLTSDNEDGIPQPQPEVDPTTDADLDKLSRGCDVLGDTIMPDLFAEHNQRAALAEMTMAHKPSLPTVSSATESAIANDANIARLAKTIEAMISQCAPSQRPEWGATSETKTPTEALASIAEITQSLGFRQPSQVRKLSLEMARHAADATIYAGEVMRRANEMMKQVTEVLESLGQTATMAASATSQER